MIIMIMMVEHKQKPWKLMNNNRVQRIEIDSFDESTIKADVAHMQLDDGASNQHKLDKKYN